MSNTNAIEFFTHGQATFKGTVCVIGSTKFFDEYMELNRFLTFNGWFVLGCGQWGHSYHKDKPMNLPKSLDHYEIKVLHLHKITQADVVVVCTDKTGYTGESTDYEQRFSQFLSKPIFVWNGSEFTSGRCHLAFNNDAGASAIAKFLNHPYQGANPVPR